MIEVSVGGNLLGVVYNDRNERENAKSLDLTLQQAQRIWDTIPTPGSALPSKIRDLGPGLTVFALTTERAFDDASSAVMWLLDIGAGCGFSGAVTFRAPDGQSRTYAYAVAEPGQGHTIGASVVVPWTITIGRKCG